jgi:DNA invertase Pin-like site-specific DNA recombinase
MKVLYVRISSLDQNTARQKIYQEDFKRVIEDKCSGAIPFFERTGGREIKTLVEKKAISSLSVTSIDRLGRNLMDILHSIEYFNEKKIPIYFINQGLCTLDSDGKENGIAKLIISILGTVGEMERNQIRERQREGIEIAKMKGAYQGRNKGTKEDTLKFLSKPKNKKVLECLGRGLNSTEAAKVAGVHPNTVTKIKKIGFIDKVLLK